MISDVIGPVTPGAPVVHVAGFIALLLVTFTGQWAGSLVTITHETGHVLVALASGRDVTGFQVTEGSAEEGVTRYQGGWGVSHIFIALAGYFTSPLLGLAGANLVLAGKAWSVLWVAVIILGASFIHARGAFTNLLVVGYGALIGWVAVTGSPDLQAIVAVLLVWWLLFGEIRGLAGLGFGNGGDTAALSRMTWIPAVLWLALFWFVAVICLWVGGRRLLGF